MKARSLLNIAGLASGLVVPSLAKQKETIDPNIDPQIRMLAAKFDEAINRHDAVAVAMIFTEDGVGEIPESKVSAGHGRSRTYDQARGDPPMIA